MRLCLQETLRAPQTAGRLWVVVPGDAQEALAAQRASQGLGPYPGRRWIVYALTV
jgi:hypothetical protein